MEKNAVAPTVAEADPGRIKNFEMIPINSITPSPLNRKCSDDDPGTLSLADSLRQEGMVQPIIIRPLSEGKYEIVCGERRWRAARKNGWREIRCGIVDCDDKTASVLRLVENVQRQELEPLEEGDAVAALLKTYDGSAKEVAARLKWEVGWVYRRAQLPKLSDAWRSEITNPDTVYDHVKKSVERLEELARLPVESQDALLADGRLQFKRNTREFRATIAQWMRRLDSKPWPYEFDKTTYSGSSGKRCEACLKRSSKKDGGLFDDLVDASAEVTRAKDRSDLCLDPACWNAKTIRFIKSQIENNPGIYLLADGYQYNATDEETYGQRILAKSRYVECNPNQSTPAGYSLEGKGVFVAGDRIGKIIDILLRDDEQDRGDDAARLERLKEGKRRRKAEDAFRNALAQACAEVLPNEAPNIDIRVLLSFCLWFSLDWHGREEGDTDYLNWNVEQMAWDNIRQSILYALMSAATDGYDHSDDADIETRNRSLVISEILSRLHIDLVAVKARAEELCHAPAD